MQCVAYLQIAKMRESKQRRDEEKNLQGEDLHSRAEREAMEPAECKTTMASADHTVSDEDAISRYAEEDRRRDAEKLRMRDQARLAAQRMDERMDEKRATREEDEREWKEEKERLSRICEKYYKKQDMQQAMDEEQENVRMVEKYMQREAESARRLQERKLAELDKALNESVRMAEALQASMLKNETEIVPMPEEEKKKVRMDSCYSRYLILTLIQYGI